MAKQITDNQSKPVAAVNDVLLIRDVTTNSDKKTTVGGLAGAVAPNLPADSINADMIDFGTITLNRKTFTAETSHGATTALVPWNGCSNISFNVPAGTLVRIRVHEPVINGYSGNGAICLNAYSSASVSGGMLVGAIGATGISGAGVDGWIEFTTTLSGPQYVVFLFNCYGIGGTLTIVRSTTMPANYSIERIG